MQIFTFIVCALFLLYALQSNTQQKITFYLLSLITNLHSFVNVKVSNKAVAAIHAFKTVYECYRCNLVRNIYGIQSESTHSKRWLQLRF